MLYIGTWIKCLIHIKHNGEIIQKKNHIYQCIKYQVLRQ
jgi:hypothetical protein